jgi:NAD-reducing hydrogenase large subunit
MIHKFWKRTCGVVGVNANEGVGIIEAPRGTLIHHYKADEDGAITWADLIVATGHNNLAIGKSVQQVSEHFIDGEPCVGSRAGLRSLPDLSCSTHANGLLAMNIRLVGCEGRLLDELHTD